MVKWLFGTGQPSRLDRLEQIVDRNSTAISALIEHQEQQRVAINALVERQEQQRVAIDTLIDAQLQQRELNNQLAGAINLLAALLPKAGQN